MTNTLREGDQVVHPRFGVGSVLMDRGETIVIRFDEGLHECVRSELQQRDTVLQAADRAQWHPLSEVVLHLQAESIVSVNDSWGVFSRSSIALLPHQLWVCKKVNESWPTRWLVADDVGLGKTIEAGLILMPLLANRTIRRLLVMCPASLVTQWQARLIDMFDIRLTAYSADQDTAQSRFWDVHDNVVASFHTLRANRNGRHERMFESGPWDMVIVDEAHHLNHDAKSGPTNAYLLLESMLEQKLIDSMVFFTGTPHRGKTFGFLALLHLLRPEVFNPMKDPMSQLPELKNTMIRNNKYTVTDLSGRRLFKHPKVTPISYAYSEEENEFYNLLTDFIASGRAYAGRQDLQTQNAVALVLIAMQKLAASSVAAIRRAIAGRLERMRQTRAKVAALQKRLADLEQAQLSGDDDVLNQLQEELVSTSTELILTEHEEENLEALLAAANRVKDETKIRAVVDLAASTLDGRSVLFFTEYKATQSLLMTELMRRFKSDCAGFINGDERADGVVDHHGRTRSLRETKAGAAERFNAGKVRFLVSTEAGGEGIDLQSVCHTLVHVDLPWNPMRMQQRVGRLNRYGQQKQVEVFLMHNPDTVEARIWAKLDEKIRTITQALEEVMEEPEDLQTLILGMGSPGAFADLFARAHTLPGSQRTKEGVSRWFDSNTGFFGGQDALKTVRDLVGNAQRFDFGKVSGRLPQVDLPDLVPFMTAIVEHNGRRVTNTAEGMSFNTPDEWLKEPAVRRKYEKLLFDRSHLSGRSARERVIGVGHRAMDHALEQARAFTSTLGLMTSKSLESPVIVFRVRDRVTVEARSVRSAIAAVRMEDAGPDLIADWQLLQLLNKLTPSRGRTELTGPAPATADEVTKVSRAAASYLTGRLPGLDYPFQKPEVEVAGILWPGAR